MGGISIEEYNLIIEKSRTDKSFITCNGKDVMWFPFIVPQNVTYYRFLEELFYKYSELLTSFDFITSELAQDVNKISKSLLTSLKSYDKGNIVEAYSFFLE